MALGLNPSNPSYGTYTNQGSSQKKRLLVVIIGGVVVLVVIVVLMILINTLTSGPKNDFISFTARQDSLYQFVTSQQDKIQNSDLRKINADAGVLLLGSSVTLYGIMNRDFGVSSLPDNAVALAADSISGPKLKDASMVGHHDSTYQSILLSKLRDQIAALQTVKNKSAKAVSQQKLDVILATMQLLQKQLTALTL